MRFASLVALTLGVAAAPAADLTKIDRTLKKEPVYQSKSPRYGLLVFGPKAETRVWLVLDVGDGLAAGDGSKTFLYVDRNGDGDLTGPGEKVACTVKKHEIFVSFSPELAVMYGAHFEAGDVVEKDGKTKHTGLTIDVGSFVQTYRPVSIAVKANGTDDQFAGGQLLAFADRPADAPIIHFGGPLMLRVSMENGRLFVPINYDEKIDSKKWYAEHRPQYELNPLVRGESRLLVAQLGTPGLGRGTFAALSAGVPPADVHPVAEVELRDAAGKPVVIKTELNQRCCGTLFRGPVEVPADAALGTAKVTVSFPAWTAGAVMPGTGEVEVTKPVKSEAGGGTKE
jgi:hypothetical protein